MKSTLFKLVCFCVLCVPRFSFAEDIFPGEKSSWHGFDRYDFLIDESNFAVTPFKSSPEEGDGIAGSEQGKRRCVIVVPKQFAEGRPWSWRGCYWNHEPQTEIELLKRGFAIGYVTGVPGRAWETWHQFLVEKHGFSTEPAFIGMSRGGEYSYTWAVRHPDKISCIYADNPVHNSEILSKLAVIAEKDVPVLHVNGSIDPLLARTSDTLEKMVQQFGGRISVIIKEGAGHHPHSLRNPKPIADFIEKSFKEKSPITPNFAVGTWKRTNYYSSENIYREFPDEKNYMTLRGPEFVPNYKRYEFHLPDVQGVISVVVPHDQAQGNPWFLRADFLERDSTVDQMLLERGVTIVTGAVPYGTDGPVLADWNRIYEHFTQHGFSRKPILGGAGGAACEAFGWAIANPEKVSSLYVENPVLRRSHILSKPVLDNLTPLAEAGVPIFAVCGQRDAMLLEHATELQNRYRKLSGQIVVHFEEKGRYPNAPQEPRKIVDELLK